MQQQLFHQSFYASKWAKPVEVLYFIISIIIMQCIAELKLIWRNKKYRLVLVLLILIWFHQNKADTDASIGIGATLLSKFLDLLAYSISVQCIEHAYQQMQ